MMNANPNVTAALQQMNQYYKDQMLVSGKMSLRAFNLQMQLANHIIRFPQDSQFLSHLTRCKNIKSEYVIFAQQLGQTIMDYKMQGEEPRKTDISSYGQLVRTIITLAPKEATEILIGMVFGEKSKKIMERWEKEDDEEDDKELFS